MNDPLIQVIALIFAMILIFKFGFKLSKSDLNNTARPNDTTRPTKLIENDKIITVENLKLEYIKQAIGQYCNICNQKRFIVLPRLIILENHFVILFPYDIEFDQFCYFINYLKYAHELSLKSDYKPEIRAWCTTKSDFAWITDEIVNKNVMLFMPDWDKEYGSVYLTTHDNLGFKFGFAARQENQKFEEPILQFDKMLIDLNLLKSKETIDFK